ncbi:hypothetical protein WJX72_003134 [[Myrmecia] bisecta]|uniref:Protein kinase domain-containing protein n=1 Tax=[Myrmecia] bisecta TaxID=41462 RepID=A0AAW1PGR5_9CHLO
MAAGQSTFEIMSHLSNPGSSNEAKLKLLEKRLIGEHISPKSLTFDGHFLAPGETSNISFPGDAPSPAVRAPPSPTASSDGEGSRDAFHISVHQGRKKRRLHEPGLKKKQAQEQQQQRNTIHSYFPALGGEPSAMSRGGKACSPGPQTAHVSCQTEGSGEAALQRQLSEARAQLDHSVAQHREREAEMQAACQAAERETARLRSNLETLQQQAKDNMEAAAGRQAALRQMLVASAGAGARSERQLAGLKLQAEGCRLGCLGLQRAGPIGMREVWEDGQAFKDVAARLATIAEQRDGIEAARKAVRRKLPPPEPLSQSSCQADTSRAQSGAQASTAAEYIAPEEYVARDEIFKVRLASLKREEDTLNRERERLEVEKLRHVRELKRLKDEEESRFNTHPVLNNRYLLLNMLGKGGFSEVYKAVDLEGARQVAIKFHQLNPAWSDSKKQSYVRHAMREYNIHKELRHARIVALRDIFEIDTNTFATVLDLCPGGDLEAHLKEHQVLPEKEARVIAAQIFQGLAYLNAPGRRIIHYDLKPANIMFDCYGEVKITDFGLSKIVEEGQTRGLELTSQGAGTYWYLPPECFETGSQPPMISNKVDVWSVGVILYQMLYGKRPFGEGLCQEQILRGDVMLNAKAVVFPAKPAVSAEAKDFILRCLAHRQHERLDVVAAAADPYLALKRARPSSTPAKQAAERAAHPAAAT